MGIENGRLMTTVDLAFAAYAHMNGVQLIEASESRNKIPNQYYFTFDCDPDEWRKLQVSFTNSESQKFDSSVRSMKKLCRK